MDTYESNLKTRKKGKQLVVVMAKHHTVVQKAFFKCEGIFEVTYSSSLRAVARICVSISIDLGLSEHWNGFGTLDFHKKSNLASEERGLTEESQDHTHDLIRPLHQT